MKRSFLIIPIYFLLLLCAVNVHAQELKLKKGQKMSYETLEIDDYGTYKFVYFDEYEIVVKSASKEGYLLTASKSRSIMYDGYRIVDSQLPLEEQPKTYDAIANKVIRETNYQLTIDKTGKVLKTEGVAAIKEKVLVAFKELNAATPHTNIESYTMNRLVDRAFSRPIERLLIQKIVATVDTVKTGTSRYEITGSINGVPFRDSVFNVDSMHVKKQIGYEMKTGLLMSSLRDSSSSSLNTRDGKVSFKRSLIKMNLKSSNIRALGFGQLLLDEVKKLSDYDAYFSPVGRAAAKVYELETIYDRTKAKVGVKDSILNIIAELDKQMKKDDYPYVAAKAGLMSSMGMDLGPSIGEIPYEYFKEEFYILIKLRDELNENNHQNLNKAISLIYGKFPSGNVYPQNMHILESAFHVSWAKHVFESDEKNKLSPILKAINEIDKLGYKGVSGSLNGLKTYIQVKLSDDKNVLNTLIASNHSAPYDKYGRYRLLIFDELDKKGVADSIRLAYIDLTIDKLKKSVLDSGDFAKELRPFFRKYLADAYYRKSQLDKKNGLVYLQMASDYLPSQQDKLQAAGELQGEFEYLPAMPYNELYMAQAESGNVSKDEVLEKYAELVIIEPERYGLLKEKYRKAYPTGDFKAWFAKVLKTKLPTAPLFALKATSGEQVGSAENKNKFIFIDFWGTWCGACINEIHKIEELHMSNDKPEKLMVTTIASHDKKEYVDAFMAKRKYTYQVLMSDNMVEGKFKVSHYPTKLLLLPNGTYLIIPYADNYKALIDKYLAWDI